MPQNSAKSLASALYQTHAVVIGSLDGPYYSELLMGYEEVAARYDQELLLVVADDRAAAGRWPICGPGWTA